MKIFIPQDVWFLQRLVLNSAVSFCLAAKPRRKRPPKVFNTAPQPGPGSANEDVPVVIVHDVGVQATGDDAQLLYSVEEEVEEISKALELPDLDAEDSDCGSDFEFS